MNILVTSISAKVQLLELIREAQQVWPGARLVGADADPLAVARAGVDRFETLPPDSDPAYGDALTALCRAENIRLIIPTRDNELIPLARLAAPLAAVGTVVPLPPPAALETCLDKQKFHQFCLDEGFPVLPRRSPMSEADFPVFVRLTSPAGSRSAFLVPDMTIWQQLGLKGDRYICQPLCRDREYSCDVLMDFAGQPLQAVVRRRERIVHGESWRSVVVDDPALADMALKLCARLGLVGHNLVQAFRSTDGAIHLIEVNARFGGCSNLSVRAGLASPERMLALLAGDDTARAPRRVCYGLRSNRHARDVYEEPAP